MILVTGATGTTGRLVLEELVRREIPVRAMSRTPDRLPAGVNSVRGDYEDPGSLRRAVDGVQAVFLLSAPGPWIPGHDLAMLDAAKDVRRIVKISAMRTGDKGFETTSGWHLPGEQALQDSDREWTVLRPSVFASNSLAWLPQIQAGQPIPVYYGDGGAGVVDPRDIAAVAVEALISEAHNKQVYTLTGSEVLSVPDQVAQLGEVLGKSLRTTEPSADQIRAEMLGYGIGSDAIDLALAGYEVVRNGAAAFVTDDVANVIGRPPRTFREWAEDHRTLFA
jgi:uncharacterized protein YbjT (DUF2867 family)